MELELHSINGMRNMEVIDVLTGSKLGFIRDLKIDCDTNKVISLISSVIIILYLMSSCKINKYKFIWPMP